MQSLSKTHIVGIKRCKALRTDSVKVVFLISATETSSSSPSFCLLLLNHPSSASTSLTLPFTCICKDRQTEKEKKTAPQTEGASLLPTFRLGAPLPQMLQLKQRWRCVALNRADLSWSLCGFIIRKNRRRATSTRSAADYEVTQANHHRCPHLRHILPSNIFFPNYICSVVVV